MSSTQPRLPFSKVCDITDFASPELAPVIRDVCGFKRAGVAPDYPRGAEHRKDWEVAMAVRALRHFGALRSDAIVLGVAAGTEDTVFYLTGHVRQVFATDRYLSSGPWQPVAPISMVVDPSTVAPNTYDPERLIVQHMDGRRLLYPADTFDGIFSSGSIEHFGDLYDVAAAAFEMGRVLKPDGVLSLSTEFRLAGPPGGIGWPGSTLLFTAEDLQRFIVDASGLELVGTLQHEVSDETLATRRDITQVIEDRRARQPGGPAAPVSDAIAWDDRPHVVLLHDGYVFTSVHLTLRKTAAYPSTANDWARPSAAVLEVIAGENRRLIERASLARPAPPAPPPRAAGPDHATAAAAFDLTGQQEATAHRLATAAQNRLVVENEAAALQDRLADVEAALATIDTARHGADTRVTDIAALARRAETARRVAGAGPSPLHPGAVPATSAEWRCSTVRLATGLQFSVVTDPAVTDPVASALAGGTTIDEGLVGLMLDVIGPGQRMLDLGAHVGTFSLAAAAAGAQVLAVEGSPRNVALLRESVRRNYFSDVRVVHAAVSDAPGTVEFLDDGPWGGVPPPGTTEPTVTVPAVTLTELLAELRWWPLAFVKMDVEGSEIRAIRGMKDVLEAADAPAVLYESNGHTLGVHGVTPEQLIAEFESLGYTSYLVDQHRLVRVRGGEPQPQTIVDYLAVKRLPRGLRNWKVELRLTPEEWVARVTADADHPNPDHRNYVAGMLQRAGDDVRADPAIAACLARLQTAGTRSASR